MVYVKLRMRQLFPMNFGEALGVQYNNPQLAQLGISPIVPASPLPPLPAYVSYLNNLGITQAYVSRAAYSPQPYESAACLLMAMQRTQSGGGGSGDVGTGGSTQSIPLGGNQSIRAYVDAWGQPLYFTRSPGRLSVGQQQSPGSQRRAARHQRSGRSPGLTEQPGLVQRNTTLFTQLTLQPLAGGNCSYKLMPMLASSGPDRDNRGKNPSFDPIWLSVMTPVTYNDDLFSTP